MLKEISKKLTMKKTFFVTQLETFFNTISQEYQEIINNKDVDISILKEKITKYEHDIKNLVKIKNDLLKREQINEKIIQQLREELSQKSVTKDGKSQQSIKLEKENELLKNQLQKRKLDHQKEVEELKNKVSQLQNLISKGANAYNSNLANQSSEKLIEEISKSLKK